MSIYVDSRFILLVRFIFPVISCCDSQLAKLLKKSPKKCYGIIKIVILSKKKPKRKETPFVFLIIVFIHFICFY